MAKMKVVIIGSGVAALAAAARLTQAGFHVHVFEKMATPGGKLSEKWIGQYRFDLGPSLFTLPENVEEVLDLFGKNRSSFSYKRLNPVCEYFYEDGTRFSAAADHTVYVEKLSEVFNEKKHTIEKFLKSSKATYELTAPVFLKSELSFSKLLFKADTYRAIFQLYKLPLLGSLNGSLKKRFRSEKIIQLFNRYATYNGSNPYSTPAMMQLIPHLENGIGAFLPEKGMYDISRTLYNLAHENGAVFHFNSSVEEIIHDGSKVKGVRVNGEVISSEIVISNLDITPTYRYLLKNFKAPERLLNQEKSSSALIFYWGVKAVFSEMHVHNIFFSDNYKEEFDHIFLRKDLYSDPTVYVNITSKECTQDAPVGCENWFVMINVPHLAGQDWPDLIEKSRKRIIAKLSRILKKDIDSLIEVEEVLTPQLIQDRTGSFLGSLYGNASNNTFAAFRRHNVRSNDLKGMYFCGGSVHPGGGIPLCMFSGKLVAEAIKEEYL